MVDLTPCSFFEWDASLVRDGTYDAAMLLTKAGGSDEDVAVCIQALNVSDGLDSTCH